MTSEMTTSNSTMYHDGHYAEHNPDWHEGDSDFKADAVVAILRAHDITPASAVDVGCGAGKVVANLSVAMPATRWTGCDISPQAAQRWPIEQSAGVSYELRDFCQGTDHHDLVMALDVAEHVPDYLGFLDAIRSRSTWCVINWPLDMNVVGLLSDHQVVQRRDYGHLHYFSVRTALATTESAGFEIIESKLLPGFRAAGSKALQTSPARRFLQGLRVVAYRVSPKLTAKWLGGMSLLVLARSKPASGAGNGELPTQ